MRSLLKYNYYIFLRVFKIFTTSSVIASANRSFSLWVLPLYIATVIIGIVIMVPKLVQKVIGGYEMLKPAQLYKEKAIVYAVKQKPHLKYLVKKLDSGEMSV